MSDHPWFCEGRVLICSGQHLDALAPGSPNNGCGCGCGGVALSGLHTISKARLHHAFDIHGRETDLHRDERGRADMEAPGDPQCVTQQENPEAHVTSALIRRRNQAGSCDRADHGWPLEQIDDVPHLCVVNVIERRWKSAARWGGFLCGFGG